MKKFSGYVLVVLGTLAAGCSRPSAVISGCIAGGEHAKVAIVHQGASTQRLLDTLRTDARGCFRYTLQASGSTFSPMFISLTLDDAPVATLLVEAGEQLHISATKGVFRYTVEGSESSRLLQQVNTDLYEATQRFDSLTAAVRRSGSTTLPDSLSQALSEVYVKQYRAAVRFLVKNPSSLVCVSVLNQYLPNGLQVFSREEDVFRFKMTYDSLLVRYPNSEYLPPLREEYERRFNRRALQEKIGKAFETGYIDIRLPDTAAGTVALSSLTDEVVVVYFWQSTDPEQRMYNNELKALYARYHPKGLGIYQIALDTDKAVWAKAVNDQQLPWVNVCDGLGAASPVLQTYGVKKLPAAFLIHRQTLVAAGLSNTEMAQKVAALCR